MTPSKSAVPPKRSPAQRDAVLAFDPYALDSHAQALVDRGVMLAPIVVIWRYRIARERVFRGWLRTKEIVLAPARMSLDAELRGVRYGGTYRVGDDGAGGPSVAYRTMWGYGSDEAVQAMHGLCSDLDRSRTIIQNELVDFVKGLKGHIAEAGDQHFAQEVLAAAATVRSAD